MYIGVWVTQRLIASSLAVHITLILKERSLTELKQMTYQQLCTAFRS